MTGNERWKWLAVEIAEIRRCAGLGDQAHDRLALLLIDLWVPNWSSTAVTCGIAEQ